MSIRQTDDADSREAVRGEDADTDGVVLEITDLRAGYGEVPVLHGVSLQLHEGEAIGIVGHNGMGKTTLLQARSWACCRRPAARSSVDGVDVTTWAAHERSRLGIAYVPQGRGILPGPERAREPAPRLDPGLRGDRSSVRSSAWSGFSRA